MSLVTEDQKYIANVYRRLDVEIVKGEGCYLYDKDGNKYLDMYSGIAVNALGHSDQIREAVISQLNQYMHLSNYFVSEPVVSLAKKLCEASFATKVFFSNSGTEANEAAIKLARKYGKAKNENKIELLALTNSFHGRTYGGLSLTAQEKYKAPFAPLVPGVVRVETNNIDDLRNKMTDRACALFLEMIQGEGGIVELDEAFVQEAVKLAKAHDVLIVVDEIQTGLGRTGDLFAYEKYGFTPDLVTLAKALGGGIPLGALLISKHLEQIFEPGEHGSTFGGNPLAAAAGNVILGKVTNSAFLAQVKAKGQKIIDGVKALQEKRPDVIKGIRGRGLILGIETGSYANKIKEEGLKHHLLLNVTSGTVVRVLPGLTITDEEIDTFLSRLALIIETL